VVTPSLTRELRAIEGARLWANAPLAPFTTIATGGKAALLVTVASPTALCSTLAALERAGVPWVCLGAGSNLLVADQGYPGAIVKLDEAFSYLEGLPPRGERHPEGIEVGITVGAGAFLSRLSAVVAESGLSGLEFACGIPGSVGGGVAMNAGAHGGSISDVVEEMELVSAAGMARISGEDVEWDYRSCGLPPGSVVTGVRLRLVTGESEAILLHQRTLLRARMQSQPRGSRTFGSAFKNPTGDSAGRLLDRAGLKGVHRGGAEVSTVHANFVVNHGDATTSDVLTLMGLMRQGVERMSGVLLEPEVKLLGASYPWEGHSQDAGASSETDG
jgi:UDP-N-acetylmuramate dehydrogenase